MTREIRPETDQFIQFYCTGLTSNDKSGACKGYIQVDKRLFLQIREYRTR